MSGSIAIYTFKNITNKLFLSVKPFDPGLKLLEEWSGVWNGPN